MLPVHSKPQLSTESMINGIKEDFAKHCKNCKNKIINVPVPEWSTKIQPNVQSSLLADPSINYIIPIYDSMSQFVVPAITITGAGDRVKIATFNGTPFVLGLIQLFLPYVAVRLPPRTSLPTTPTLSRTAPPPGA